MMSERLYISLYRDRRGTYATLSDTRTDRELRLPAFLLSKLIPHVPRDVIRLFRRVQRAWLPDFGAVTVWVESPVDSADWLTEETADRLSAEAPTGPGGGVAAFFSEHARVDIEQTAGILRFDNLRRCTEFGLHNWHKRPYTGEWVCRGCSAAADRVRLDGSSAASLIRAIVRSHLWKLGNERYFGPFQRQRDTSSSKLPLRLLLDTAISENALEADQASLNYLIGVNGQAGVQLAILPEASNPWAEVRSLELGTNEDVQHRTHHHLVLTDFGFPEHRDLGTEEELDAAVVECGGGEDGRRRAFLLAVARESCHAIVTNDRTLLAREPGRRDAKVLTPQEAVVLIGIRLRYADHVPVSAPGARSVRISIRPHHFNQARPFAVAPAFANRFAAVIAGAKQGLWPDRSIRLFRGCLSRLTLLYEAEDQLAYLWHFPQERSSADDDAAYHLEFLLMVAQALLDSLKALAAERHGIQETQIISWRSFLEHVKAVNEGLYSFLTSPTAKAVRTVVHELRRPLAHAEHWWGTSHVGGSEDPTLVSLIIPGEPAILVPKSIVIMREEPETWGISAWAYDIDRPEIKLQGYPFALNFNGRLLWFVREFLAHLRLEIDLSDEEIALSRPSLEWLTNPGLDAVGHSIVRILSLPLPA